MLNDHPFHSGRGTLLFAHRGGGGEVAENSFQSLDHVRRLGLTYVETDAHVSSDGVVILHHDATLDRTTDARGRISARSWRELSTVRDHSGDGLVRLEEALERYPSLKFNVDAKSDQVVGPLAAIAVKHPDRIGLASFSTRRLQRLRQLAPGVANSLGQGEVARLWAYARSRSSLARVKEGFAAFGIATSIQIPPKYRGLRVLTPRLVSLSHDLGLAIHVWDVESPRAWGSVLDMGADGICTDYPAAARAFLETRGN